MVKRGSSSPFVTIVTATLSFSLRVEQVLFTETSVLFGSARVYQHANGLESEINGLFPRQASPS